ncbi:hypothetical protein [Pedococcus soli]
MLASRVVRPLGSALEVDPVDGRGDWSRHLALAWSALADPDGYAAQMPSAPGPDADLHEHTAWWTPLVHLTRFALGLPCPAAGLQQLLGTDRSALDPGANAVLRVVDLWWGDRVLDFIAWGTAGGDELLARGNRWPLKIDPPVLDLAAADDPALSQRRRTPQWTSVWQGGGDPMHLSSHSDHPLARECAAPISADADHLTVTAPAYGGWYRTLLLLSEVAPQQGQRVDVILRPFGRLGTFAVQRDQLPRLASPSLPERAPNAAAPGRAHHEGGAASPEPQWHGVLTAPDSLNPEAVDQAHTLANAAKAGDWERVLALLDGGPGGSHWDANTWRPGSRGSGFTPLHQAAWHGAPADVVEALLRRGAWRSLRTTEGQTAADIATARGHTHLDKLLDPPAHPWGAETDLFAGLDRQLAELVEERQRLFRLVVPVRPMQTRVLLDLPEHSTVWFPIPGMYGGFAVRYLRSSLLVESWSRVAGGSGQAHLVTAHERMLVAQGFV